MQALLTRECVGKGFGVRGLDCAQPGDEALLVVDRDAVEALRRGLALGDILTRAAHKLKECRLIFARDCGRLHHHDRHSKRRGKPIEWRSRAPSNTVAPLAANALFDLNPSCVDMLR